MLLKNDLKKNLYVTDPLKYLLSTICTYVFENVWDFQILVHFPLAIAEIKLYIT